MNATPPSTPLQVDYLQSVVDTLHDLIRMLFPEPSLDVFTLEAFLFRHKLTGLGENAIRSIEQSRRISRQINNYQQAGLCEFHIGLIYLAVGDVRGARQQFETARQQWSFIYDPAAVGLALFAEGAAQQLAFHYEAAMACYAKAGQWLPRIRFAPPSHYPDRFLDRLTNVLQAYQQALRDRLWPVEPESEVEEEATTAVSHRSPDETADRPHTTPPPIVRLDQAAVEQAAVEQPAVEQPAVPLIIPGHQQIAPDYEWYLIERQPEADFFPADVQKGGWLLVHKSPPRHAGELVLVVVSDSNGTQGRVLVKPLTAKRPYPRIYLAWLEETDGSFNFDENGAVTFSPEIRQVPVTLQEILGVVVGFWLPVQIQ